MAHIPIWPGSSSFSAGIAAFGFYDKDKDFPIDTKFAQVGIVKNPTSINNLGIAAPTKT